MKPIIFTCKWKDWGQEAGVLHTQVTHHKNAAKQNSCHSMTQGGMPLSMHSHRYPPVYSSFVCGGFLKECFMLNARKYL